jgi:hypothetical protein
MSFAQAHFCSSSFPSILNKIKYNWQRYNFFENFNSNGVIVSNYLSQIKGIPFLNNLFFVFLQFFKYFTDLVFLENKENSEKKEYFFSFFWIVSGKKNSRPSEKLILRLKFGYKLFDKIWLLGRPSFLYSHRNIGNERGKKITFFNPLSVARVTVKKKNDSFLRIIIARTLQLPEKAQPMEAAMSVDETEFKRMVVDREVKGVREV